MDGNGRWAKKRSLPRQVGHRYGARTFRTITKYCEKIGIKCLTVYAFSTENWKRPQSEVDSLMALLKEYLEESLSDFKSENIKTRFIGDISPLSPEIRELIKKAEELTKDKTGLCLNIALNYGGREELTRVARSIAKEVAEGRLSPEDIGEELLQKYLYTAGQPDPDLIIRPSGSTAPPISFVAVGIFRICVYGCTVAGFQAGRPRQGSARIRKKTAGLEELNEAENYRGLSVSH